MERSAGGEMGWWKCWHCPHQGRAFNKKPRDRGFLFAPLDKALGLDTDEEVADQVIQQLSRLAKARRLEFTGDR